MAEDLEADPSVDIDRLTDHRDFQREQFDVLVQKYRESDGEDGGEFHLKQEAMMKKELLNAKRKLMKGKYFLQTLPIRNNYADLIERIDLTCLKVDKVIKEDAGGKSDEFSVLNASLQDYEVQDIELLNLEPVKSEMPNLSLLSVSDRQKAKERAALAGECDILINECHDIISDLKK